MNRIETPPHLGGHEGHTWVDRPVLAYLQHRYAIETMIDVGCGPGGMLDLANELRIHALGVDGDPAVVDADRRIVGHDYTKGPYLAPTVDLVWCVEFVEHVEERYQANYLATFAAGRVLWLTHALPGQGGHHHVNEQPPVYWHAVLEAAGWRFEPNDTERCRLMSVTPFGKATGMVWTKERR